MRIFAVLISLAAAMSVIVSPLQAGPALLFEPSTGKVLYAEDLDHQWHPASLTKIMTAYLVFEDIRAGKLAPKTKIACSKAAHAQPPSKVGLPIGSSLLLETALKALIIKSANDVAVMLAEAVAGSEEAFIVRMNATAKRLGMTRTHFVNPNGLPARAQVTTARDLAKLARAVVTEFPEHAEYWKMKSFRIGKKRLSSHNGLLKTFEGADGLKTGFICDSGFNVVASATRGSTRLMAIVLGEPSGRERTIRAASIMEYGFQQYVWKTFFNSTTIDNMPFDANAKAVQSVRNAVAAYSCGNRAAARKLQRAKAKARAARRAKRKSSLRHGSGSNPAQAPARAATNQRGTKKVENVKR